MSKVVLKRSRDELRDAAEAADRLASAQTFHDLEEAWKAFLRATERVWYKLVAQLGRDKRWGAWVGAFERARKKDPLLAYVRHARGAAEHSLLESVGVGIRDSSLGRLALIGQDGKRYRLLDIPGTYDAIDQLVMVSSGAPMAQMTWDVADEQKHREHPRVARLPSIKHQGVTFHPPATHMGQPVDPRDIVGIARLTVAWYEQTAANAEAFFSRFAPG